MISQIRAALSFLQSLSDADLQTLCLSHGELLADLCIMVPRQASLPSPPILEIEMPIVDNMDVFAHDLVVGSPAFLENPIVMAEETDVSTLRSNASSNVVIMAPRPINQPPNPVNAIEIDDNASEVSIATASTNREILAATRFLACQAFLRQLWVGHLTATGQVRLIEPAHGDVIVNGDDDIQEGAMVANLGLMTAAEQRFVSCYNRLRNTTAGQWTAIKEASVALYHLSCEKHGVRVEQRDKFHQEALRFYQRNFSVTDRTARNKFNLGALLVNYPLFGLFDSERFSARRWYEQSVHLRRFLNNAGDDDGRPTFQASLYRCTSQLEAQQYLDRAEHQE